LNFDLNPFPRRWVASITIKPVVYLVNSGLYGFCDRWDAMILRGRVSRILEIGRLVVVIGPYVDSPLSIDQQNIHPYLAVGPEEQKGLSEC